MLRELPASSTPKYVFAAVASRDSTAMKHRGVESPAPETDEMEVDSKSVDEEEEKQSGVPRSDSAPLIPEPSVPRDRNGTGLFSGPRGHDSSPLTPLSSSASTSQDALSAVSADKSSPPPLASPSESAAGSVSSYFDCRSRHGSPPPLARTLSNVSDREPSPSQDLSGAEEEEQPEDESAGNSQAIVLHAPAPTTSALPLPAPAVSTLQGPATASPVSIAPRPTFQVDPQELDGYLTRIGAFLARLYTVENADALAFLRQADALIRQHPEFLDISRMRVNEFLDTDLVNVLQHPDITTESCTQFANRLQRARDAHPEWFAWYTEVRRFVLAFIQYLDELFRRRRWELDETLLHQRAPVPPPYLHPYEYQRLRVLLYTFDAHGQDEVVRTIHKFLRYRFRDTETVAHFLFAGLFETNDVVRDHNGGFKAVSSRRAFTSIRASSSSNAPFRKIYPYY
ncbi:hypothetical protein C8R47DRAFT_1231336 [Mycena vitilis]|nr:hypothetical protein C8R47DRAFT_1231336 [Mycena vitilis]